MPGIRRRRRVVASRLELVAIAGRCIVQPERWRAAHLAFASSMGAFTSWLDNQRIQPSVFPLSLNPKGTIFRLEFNTVSEPVQSRHNLPSSTLPPRLIYAATPAGYI